MTKTMFVSKRTPIIEKTIVIVNAVLDSLNIPI